MKSAKKRLRQNIKKNLANHQIQSSMKTALKKAMEALEGGLDKDKAGVLLSSAFKRIDKAAKGHVIHKNAASRKKSRLARKFANKLLQAGQQPASQAAQDSGQQPAPSAQE